MYSPQQTANRIKALAKSKKISISKILQDCDLNKNALSTMQNNGYFPRIEAIAKIADYLDCPIDFLLGRGLFENWEFILEHKEQIITNIENAYPVLKNYPLRELPESALLYILPSIVKRIDATDDTIKIFFL